MNMIQQLQTRLTELKDEFDRGQKKLMELDNEATNLRQALLRISGAIQVLQEEISKQEAGNNKP